MYDQRILKPKQNIIRADGIFGTSTVFEIADADTGYVTALFIVLTPSLLVASLRGPINVFHRPQTCGQLT